MTLPKGWKASNEKKETDKDCNKSVGEKPSASQLLRPIVSRDMLKAPRYKIKVRDVFIRETREPGSLWSPELDKTLTLMEVHPIEVDNCLVFANETNPGGQFPSLPMSQLEDIKLITEQKGFLKKNDIMLEIIFVGAGNNHYHAKIDVEDKYGEEIVKYVKRLKELESDATYWTHRTLNLQSTTTQNKIIDVFPLTTFLAEEEEIIWYNTKSDVADNKIVYIEVVTNYRILQYSYEQHAGRVILFPSLEEIKIKNQNNTSLPNPIGNYTPLASSFGAQPPRTGIIGDVVLSTDGSPFITLPGISDPEALTMVIKKAKGELSSRQEQENGSNLPGETEYIVCNKCDTHNPQDSQFCNKCGSQLATGCTKCGNQNPAESLFCGQCGSKLN